MAIRFINFNQATEIINEDVYVALHRVQWKARIPIRGCCQSVIACREGIGRCVCRGQRHFIGLVIKVMRTRRVTRISDPLICQVGNFFGRCGENWRAMFQTIGNTRGSATNGCFPSSVGKMMPNFGMLLMLMAMRQKLLEMSTLIRQRGSRAGSARSISRRQRSRA